ncbi:MAG: uroporphyrinogen decarboxylase [Deltaproteobacteria bacterium]|jgi:uroporphyrinogen decarboxylase|nr:uroporphyrinogen decarboxylase [Deltaproteobacteria bacterium]MBW2532380.1 uroporphyrinogen decarboxylase [Deltaproteobacteria bacterium]
MGHRFLRACRGEPTDVTPVWFMRQAGRYLPEYRALRAKHEFLDLCKSPELATEVTLQPLRLGVDAAILFADILLILEPMGAPFSFDRGEGPRVHQPVRERADVERLVVPDPREGLSFVFETIRLVRRELDGKVPLIGFAGAPFTVASYLIEGGRSSDYRIAKQLMWSRPNTWHLLMSKLSAMTSEYLLAQVEAGAQALQLFDSWVGALSVADYRRFVLPHVAEIFEALKDTGVPQIHFGTNTAHLLEAQQEAGGTVIGVDWRIDLAAARRRLGAGRAIQGNLDPLLLLAGREIAVAGARAVLSRAAGRPGHVFNVGHGLVPETPVETVQAVVDAVHEYRHDGA